MADVQSSDGCRSQRRLVSLPFPALQKPVQGIHRHPSQTQCCSLNPPGASLGGRGSCRAGRQIPGKTARREARPPLKWTALELIRSLEGEWRPGVEISTRSSVGWMLSVPYRARFQWVHQAINDKLRIRPCLRVAEAPCLGGIARLSHFGHPRRNTQ